MTHRLFHLIAAVLAMSVGQACQPAETPQPRQTPPSPVTQAATQPAAQTSAHPPVADRDADVLAVVFRDLLTRGGSPLARRDDPPREIRVAAKASPYPVRAEQVLMKHDKAQWAALTPEQLAAAAEAADSLVRRHAQGDPLPALAPLDDRIRVEPDSPAATQPATRRSPFDRPVHAYPPGYSADGQVAVVAMSMPWSIHHADATYVLTREGTGWRIVLRQFVYYV